MKKFNKIVLITALVLVVLGNIMYWGVKLYRYIRSDELNKDVRNMEYEIDANIRGIRIEAEAAKVVVHNSGSVESYYVSAPNPIRCILENVDSQRSDVYVEEGILNIKARNIENMEILGWNIGDGVDPENDAKVELWLPGAEYESFMTEIGAGSFDADGAIDPERFVLQVGVGTVDIVSLTGVNDGVIQVGTGDVKIRYFENIDNMRIKSGAGNIEVKMAAPVTDYDVSVKNTLGQNSIFGDSCFDINNEIIKRGTGEKQLKIETVSGIVTVDTVN